MPAGLGFMVQAIFGIMGSQSLLHLGALSVSRFNGCCMFCEVKLCLVSCKYEYFSSVSYYLVSSGL